MTKRVPINRLVSARGRKCRLNDQQIAELATSIRDGAMRNPVLVFRDILDATGQALVIVDGLARIEALKLLGQTTVEVLEAATLDEACLYLEKLREGNELGPGRQYELYQAMYPLMKRRTRNHTGGLMNDPPAVRPGAYAVMIRAFGTKSIDHLKNLVVVYNKAYKLGAPGRELLQGIQDGLFTVHGIRTRLRRIEEAQAGVVTATPEQLDLMQSIGRSIRTTVKAGARIAVPLGSHPDLIEALNQLRVARRELSHLVHRLEKGVSS